jgi:hypothetical protein
MQVQWGKAQADKISVWLFAILFLMVGNALAQEPPTPSVSKDGMPQNSETAGQGIKRWREDLNSLSIRNSNLTAETPFAGEKDEMPGYAREIIQVKWRPGDPIYLYVIRPRGVEKPPAVLYLYNYPSETDRFRNDGYCQRVTEGGFAAIGFVSALTGHRYHDRPMKEWFVSEIQESLVTSVHDVQMILNYLETRGDLDMNRIGMFGAGSGGTIAILAASVEPRIKALDLLNPWADWPEWMAKSSLLPEAERPRYVTSEFQGRIAFLDPIEWLPKLKVQSIRIQDVMDDAVTPAICKKRIEAAAPASAQVVHFDDTRAMWDASPGASLWDWIKQKVRPSAENLPQADSGSELEQFSEVLYSRGISYFPAQRRSFGNQDTEEQ